MNWSNVATIFLYALIYLFSLYWTVKFVVSANKGTDPSAVLPKIDFNILKQRAYNNLVRIERKKELDKRA